MTAMPPHGATIARVVPKYRRQTEDEEGKERKKKGGEGPVSERFNGEDADVTIVSSDGVIFKMHSYVLKTHS